MLKRFGYKIVQIETTSSCNMDCAFCPYDLRKDKISKLDKDRVFSLIDELKPFVDQIEYVTFSQFNEPLLEKNIFNYIAYARSAGLPVNLITNGLLLNKEKIRSGIVHSNVDALKISFQVISPDNFNQAKGVEINFDEYCYRIAILLRELEDCKSSTRVSIDLGANFIGRSGYFLKGLLGLQRGDPSVPLLTTKMSSDIMHLIDMLSSPLETKIKYKKSEIEQIIERTTSDYKSEAGIKISNNVFLKIKPFIYGRRLDSYYPALENFSCDNRILGILANGDVMPCCRGYDQHDIRLGNVLTHSLADVLLSADSMLDSIRSMNAEKPVTCKKCYGSPTRRGQIIKLLSNTMKKL